MMTVKLQIVIGIAILFVFGILVNMIFFLGFCFSLLIIFSLTVALSRMSNSVRTLDQMVALNEKRLQELEQELELKKETKKGNK